MKVYRSRILRHTFVMLFLVFLAGCAQRMTTVKSEAIAEAGKSAELQAVNVTADGGQVEIKANAPLTYTFYKLSTPPKAVVDLAQTTPGSLGGLIEVSKGNIKSIDVSSHKFGAGIMTRVELLLAEDTEFSAAADPADKGKLLLAFERKAAPPAPADTEKAAVNVEPAVAKAEIKEEKPAKEEAEPPVAQAVVPAAPAVTSPAASPTTLQSQEAKPAEAAKPVEESRAAAETATQVAAKEPAAEAKPAARSLPATPAAVEEPKVRQEKPAQPDAPREVVAVRKVAGGVDIEVKGGVESYNSFKLTQPERLVIDIPGAKSTIKVKGVEINAFGLGRARIGSSADKVRIVFDAEKGPIHSYQIVRQESGLLVRFGETGKVPADKAIKSAASPKLAEDVKESPKVTPQEPAKEAGKAAISEPELQKAAPVPREAKVAKGKGGMVEAIDYSQLNGLTRIAIKVSGECAAGQPVKTAKGLSVTIRNCQIPKKLQRPLDTSGFVSAIQAITPYPVKVRSGSETRVLVKLKANIPSSFRQEGNLFMWEFKEIAKAPAPELVAEAAPVKAAPVRNREEKNLEESLLGEKTITLSSKPAGKKYSGRKVSLEFSDADIRKIFQLIAEVSNLNFLISDDVTGTISIKLVNVPWDQALDVILENKGLGMQRDGNIVQIRPKAKIKSLDEEAIEAKKAEEKKMELKTKIFDVNFSNIADVEKQFKDLRSSRADATITSDARTNKVIVNDIEPALARMKALLDSLDIPEKQVMIEARIVEASSNFTRDLGVQWDIHYRDGSASFANINASDTTFGGIVSTGLPTTTTGGLAQSMSFGKLTSNVQIDLRLSAAATIGQVKIISTPKVLTVNNKAAKISQGQSIPYQTTSAEGTKTEFVEAALTLEVTPHITADGSVNMKIKASNNSPGSGTPPPINKKEATTELVVKNGETTVIGGIYVDTDTETDTGVPFLSDIPLLGWLFKSNSKTKTKTELLIFITPKLVS